MEIKYTILGLLIYLAMAAWLGAFASYAAVAGSGRTGGAGRIPGRVGGALFAAGFVALLAAVVVRWTEVGHVPMQNMFEVFLCLGMLMFPLWLACWRFLGATGPATNVLVGLVVLAPAGFIFEAAPQVLPPALQSWLFLPHVGAYLVAYVILALAGAQAVVQLAWHFSGRAAEAAACELATHRMILLGFPLLTLGLVLGAIWGKLAWGDYWNWDPKELWSLATFLIYLAYLHVRGLHGSRHSLLNAALAMAGVLAIVITLLWVNLGRMFPGLHSYAN